MVDVAVASQLQQWTFEKPVLATRPERSSSGSSASSPNLCDDAPETLRLDTAPTQESSPEPRKESVVLQERYMSSEEDLSTAGSDSEYDYEDAVIHDPIKEGKARTMSISRWDKGRSCDMAVMVSYAHVGRPKVVELDCRSPTTDGPTMQQRSASIGNLPATIINQLRKADAAQRLSMKVPATTRPMSPPIIRPSSPLLEVDQPRRPSTSHSPITHRPTLEHTDTTSTTSSFQTASSSRSSSPISDAPARPTAALEAPSSARSSIYNVPAPRSPPPRVQSTRSSFRQSQWMPPVITSGTSIPKHSFLSSDPYETSTTHSASPIIKPAAHKRLRSISMKLALAKIAITPSKKTYDSRINGRAPPTPSTPYTPMTPQTAPVDGTSAFSSPNKLRRASTILRPKSRHADMSRGPSPETAPPVPYFNSSIMQQRHSTRMVARGANEIEPTLVIPPCPSDTEDDAASSFRSRKLRKRKSLMSLMDAL